MGNAINYGGSNGHVINLSAAKEYITEEEYKRMRNAFGRFKKDFLSYDDFYIHVLGGAHLPEAQCRLLYKFCCAGAESLSFENLFCSLVGLCRIEAVQTVFIENHREFSSWGLQPPILTLPMKDDYISFYEVMSYVTHLTAEEVMELEKVFATISDRQVCKISYASWEACIFNCYPKDFSDRLFAVLDENDDGFIDFRELVCGVSTLCRAPRPSRLSLLAKLWDEDRDGHLCDQELSALFEDQHVKDEDRTILKSAGLKAAVVDVAAWAFENDYLADYIIMAEEIGHICLGLKPIDHSIELSTVRSFLRRTSNLAVSERNIVSSLWFKQWESAVESNREAPPIDNSVLRGPKEDDGWSKKVASISAESATLKMGLLPSEYIAVPPPLWKAWLRWHGSALSLDSQFTRKYLQGEYFEDGKPLLELYPLEILLVGHDKKKKDHEGMQQLSPWACAQVSRSMTLLELINLCKSELRLKENECRLWLCAVDAADDNFTLLDDESISLNRLNLSSRKINKFLLEVRDSNTGVWPQELRASLMGNQIQLNSGNSFSARPGAIGIVNGGNYCYRNAAVQCLARVTPLTEFLLKDENIASISKGVVSNNKSVVTTLEYASLLKEMWSGKKKNISPTSFNNAIRAASAIFECGEQHDCQEFVAFLIEMLHNCVHSQVQIANDDKMVTSINCVSNETDKILAKANKEWSEYLAKENSLITTLFGGQLRSLLTCRACECSSSVFEPFTSLSLPIGFDNTDLFQVIVVLLDGSIPRRYGFLVNREITVEQFRGLISDAAKLNANRMTLQCFRRRKTDDTIYKELTDQEKIGEFAPGCRLYALELPATELCWRLAAHRKLQYNYQPYLLGATEGCITSRFGLPLILQYYDGIKGKDLYDDVMRQMQRFMVPPPPAFSNRASDPCEVKTSGYPFTLSIVDKNWEWCGQCDALKFCRGCSIRPDDTVAYMPVGCSIAVDWLPTALYLKYNHSQELLLIDDPSVAETLHRYAAPSSLHECLKKFSCAESLEEPLYCEKCKRKTNKSKVMSVWRLPKYLIVHFKRFEYIYSEHRMGKCKRIIDFPLNNFDMTQFVNQSCGEIYDCIAIANHYGELSSGHFLAYARGKDEKWLLLNDCSVREVTEDEIDKSSAYLLFYERQSKP